jgi:hypothetical protein
LVESINYFDLSNELTRWKQRSMDSECRWEIGRFRGVGAVDSAKNSDGRRGKAGMAPEGPLDFVTATLGARDPFKIDSG